MSVKRAEELIKAAETDRDARHADETQKLNAVKAEMEWKLQCLEPRNRKAEAMVTKVYTL